MIATFAAQALAITVLLPAVAFALLASAILLSHRPGERRVHQILAITMSISLLLSLALLGSLVSGAVEPFTVDLGTLVAVRGYHFDLALYADTYSATYLTLEVLLCGLVGAFSAPYLHQDEGYYRFYVLLMMFSVGLSVIATGNGLDLVFAGWEIVGLSSALLIAYFIHRPAPVENGLRAFAVYRITDVGLLLGIVSLHHYTATASFEALAQLTTPQALLVGGLLIFGAMGKGAIVPFTPWLPRAMEGPTPSSAIFYGALSIHASPFLLLRASDVLERHPSLPIAVLVLGAITAFHASMVGRVQTDIKTSLGYASVTQVGLMWMWIGLGLYDLAMVHIVGHATLRTWQLLRAPSLLHDRHVLVSRLGADVGPTGLHLERATPMGFRRWAYRVALERWYLDDLWEAVARLVSRILLTLDHLDRRWASLFHEVFDQDPADSPVQVQEYTAK